VTTTDVMRRNVAIATAAAAAATVDVGRRLVMLTSLMDTTVVPTGFCKFYRRRKTFQMFKFQTVLLPARRYASAGNRHSNVSVRPSVTRSYCVKTKKASGMISSPSGSPKTLVF